MTSGEHPPGPDGTVPIRVAVPQHLRTLADVSGDVVVAVPTPVTVAAVVDALPDDQPPVLDRVRGIELVLLDIPADERTDVGAQVLGKLLVASVRFGQQVQAAGPFEQRARHGPGADMDEVDR